MRKLIYVLLIVLTSVGCSGKVEIEERISDESMLGQTVKDTIENLHVELEDSFIITEPPAVARGLFGTTPNGDKIRIFIQRGQLPLTFKGGNKIELYLDLIVTGIQRVSEKEKSCFGEVLWHYQCE